MALTETRTMFAQYPQETRTSIAAELSPRAATLPPLSSETRADSQFLPWR
jgi:hypothetical protein